MIRLYSMMYNLCAAFGEPLFDAAMTYYAFPDVERLAEATIDDIRACKVGYRAKHIKAIATALAGAGSVLERLRSLTRDEAQAELMKLPGVGPYTAALVLDVGLRRPDVLHLDSFVRETISTFYFGGRRVSDAEIAGYAHEHWRGHESHVISALTTDTHLWAAELGVDFSRKSGATRAQSNSRSAPGTHTRHIVITGAPGTGKTTLSRVLQQDMGCYAVLEDLEGHPFLLPYFREPGRWSFHLSVFFMVRSIETMALVQGNASSRCVCWDYDPRCHYEVFCQHLRAEGLLTDDEHDTCRRLHAVLVENCPKPDLTVFLRADARVLYARMQQRDRSGEMQQLSQRYVAALTQRFDDWLAQYREGICAIDTSRLDLARSEEDRRAIVALIARQLGVKCQQQ